MKQAVAIIILLCIAAAGRAQRGSTAETLRSIEVHAGVGAQKFAHLGGRYIFDNNFLVELDLGIAPFIFHKDLVSYSLGVGLIPKSGRYKSGVFYSLMYSLAGDPEDDYVDILTANIGFLSQHERGLSFQGRIGVGVLRENRYTAISPNGTFQGFAYDHEYSIWPSLEISAGYAF